MKKITTLTCCLMLSIFVFGCTLKSTPPPTVELQCPSFPQPSPAAVDKIQSLHDSEVDAWVVQLFKLKKQLKIIEQENK